MQKTEPYEGRSRWQMCLTERTYKEGPKLALDSLFLRWKKGTPLAREHRDKPLPCGP